MKSRDFSPDPRTGVKISAFPAPLEDRKLTLSSRDLLNQRGIVATGTPALAFASETAPNSRSDPKVIIGSIHRPERALLSQCPLLRCGHLTSSALDGTLRHDTFMALRGTTKHG